MAIFSKINNPAVPSLGIATVESRRAAGIPSASRTDHGDGVGPPMDDEMPAHMSYSEPAGGGSATGTMAVMKISVGIVMAGFVAVVVSWLLGRIGGYSMFEAVLGPEKLSVKVFGIVFALAALVIVPNTVRWKELSRAFSAAPAGGAPRHRPPPRGSSRGGGGAPGAAGGRAEARQADGGPTADASASGAESDTAATRAAAAARGSRARSGRSEEERDDVLRALP